VNKQIDYRCENRKKDGDIRSNILVPLIWSSLSLSENPDSNPQKGTVQPQDAFEDTAFKPGFEIVKF
jgi:hypothetical protein